MKIVADDKIPFLKGLLEPYAEVVYRTGSEINSDDVKDADALVIRTRTRCNESLLKNSAVKMIATATVGYDHIDTRYCEENGIGWTNAPGCNSGSVLQYVASALALLCKEEHYTLKGKNIAIIGVGNVGKKVERLCINLGMNVFLVDPIRALAEPDIKFYKYHEAIKNADIVTYHTPLTMSGEYATYHMLDNETLPIMKDNVVIINAARGEITSTTALLEGLRSGRIWKTVIDVWEHEPDIDKDLLNHTWIATPHIAGYSIDSKAIGTSMAVKSIADKLLINIPEIEIKGIPAPKQSEVACSIAGDYEQMIAHLLLFAYNIREDDMRLRQSPENFEKQRGDYPVRREYGAFTVVCPSEYSETILKFGFKVKTV